MKKGASVAWTAASAPRTAAKRVTDTTMRQIVVSRVKDGGAWISSKDPSTTMEAQACAHNRWVSFIRLAGSGYT